MRNPERHYAILGDGRLARHFTHYLGLLGQACSGWARNPISASNTHHDPDPERRLRRTLEPASHVLLLVADDAIAPLLRQYPCLHGKPLVHCAGALSLPGVAGAHPLMTFAGDFYTRATYAAMPFLVEAGHDFRAIFPALPNPYHSLPVAQKSLYHALCVIASNFPQILWRAAGQRMQNELGLPPDILDACLRQSLTNFLAAPNEALTGPLARGDVQTQQRNLAALRDDDLQALYRAFVEFHQAGTGAAQREQAS